MTGTQTERRAFKPTKQREPGSMEDALLICMAELGPEVCAQIVGKSVDMLRAWSDPDNDRRYPVTAQTALEAEYVSQTGREGPHLRVLARINRDCGAEIVHSGLERETMQLMSAAGDVVKAVHDATDPDSEDGRGLSENERHNINGKIQALDNEVAEIRAAANE